jgi:hypothetical protein
MFVDRNILCFGKISLKKEMAQFLLKDNPGYEFNK